MRPRSSCSSHRGLPWPSGGSPKKKHDVVTYREIDPGFSKAKWRRADTEGLARKHPALGVLVKLFAGASIGLLLAGLLLALEG